MAAWHELYEAQNGKSWVKLRTDPFTPAYLFLAANSESSFITGEVIHVNGGQAMPG